MGSQGWLPGAEEYRYRELSEHPAQGGRVVWLRDHAVLVRGEHGDYWRGYYIDITEQKQAEEALRQALERERQALERERQAARELQATLFEPFRQGPGASPTPRGRNRPLPGRRFAELHGGRAWVQDRPGGGASFQVLLPYPTTGTATATEPRSPSGVTASP